MSVKKDAYIDKKENERNNIKRNRNINMSARPWEADLDGCKAQRSVCLCASTRRERELEDSMAAKHKGP